MVGIWRIESNPAGFHLLGTFVHGVLYQCSGFRWFMTLLCGVSALVF